MHEELVMNLRDLSNWSDIAWREYAESGRQLINQAADAIEELNLIAESNRRNAKAWADTAEAAVEQIPRWVSVTERLPEECVGVLCYCSRNGQYGCGGYRKKDNGTIYWIGLNGMIPTHWMPLPEPPKEET